MVFEFLIVLSAVSTKPGDAVNLLYGRAGHAFLPATQRPTTWDFTKARRDETTLTNHAQNRWDVMLPRKGGFGRALTVLVDDLFPGRTEFVHRGGSPPLPVPHGRWLRPGGELSTVAEVLKAGKIDIERCHWMYRKRRLQVRFDPANLEGALPDLAAAVGGRFDASSRSIVFDPDAFRRHTRRSIPESVYAVETRAELELGMLRVGILHASDAGLVELFASPGGTVLTVLDSLSSGEQDLLRRYQQAAFAVMRGSGESQVETIRSKIDPSRPPSLFIAAQGTARLQFVGPDGKSLVRF